MTWIGSWKGSKFHKRVYSWEKNMCHTFLSSQKVGRGRWKKAEASDKFFDPGTESPTSHFPSTLQVDNKTQRIALNLKMHKNSKIETNLMADGPKQPQTVSCPRKTHRIILEGCTSSLGFKRMKRTQLLPLWIDSKWWKGSVTDISIDAIAKEQEHILTLQLLYPT